VSLTADIEDALVAHWSRFGLWRRGKLHDEVSLYRAAFVKRSVLTIVATAPLWSRSH
jgi:hypothetical protein